MIANHGPRAKSSSSPKDKPKKSKGPATLSSYGSQILEWIDETFEVIVYPTGFEDCIVGVGERFGGPPVAVLDVEKMLAQMEREGMTRDEAIEYFEYNILGAHVGEQNPVYLHIPNFRVEKKASTRKGEKKG